jgi:hypothetical protein
MSMLYAAQTLAQAHPMEAVGYLTAKIGTVILVVIGLVKLVNRAPSHRMPPPPPNYTAPQPYTPTYWTPPGWPPHSTPTAPGQAPPWPPHSPPPARPR